MRCGVWRCCAMSLVRPVCVCCVEPLVCAVCASGTRDNCVCCVEHLVCGVYLQVVGDHSQHSIGALLLVAA